MADAEDGTWGWTANGRPPLREAFHVEHIVDPFTGQDVVGMVRHAGWPYVVRRADPNLTLDGQCRSIGLAYLDALQAALDLPVEQWIHPDILAALGEPRPAQECRFGWLPITELDASGSIRRPVASFWVERHDAQGDALMPHLLVLVAGSVDTTHQLQVGSDMGLRIVVHVSDDEVRIHGVTIAGLSSNRALEVVPGLRQGDRSHFDLVGDARDAIGRGLDCGGVWVANIEKALATDAPPNRFIATGYALRWPKAAAAGKPTKRPARALTYDFRVELAVDPDSRAVQLVQIHRDFVIGAGATDGTSAADATGTSSRTLHCFVQDAASRGLSEPADAAGEPELPYLRSSRRSLARRRATLSDDELSRFRDPVDAELAWGELLKFNDAGGDFFEARAASSRRTARLGGSTVASSAGVVTAGDPSPPVRSDQQAVNDAHLRAAELFERMRAYGIDARAYFRFARLPLVQRVRPAMRWAPDGELPSAEVRPFLGDLDGAGSRPDPRGPLQLLVNYGSADPVHRHKLPLIRGEQGEAPGPGRRKAQYLSVASDPRWAWHEFGHVLNFAATGELEFPFAHSAGDALAAIVADPISRLADGDDPEARIRHATYPWIEVPGRSHGRSATHSYAWCGCRNLARLNFTASLERYHHSYFGEQLMSSSLFRLYRSLGGDTRRPGATARQDEPDEAVRLSASDYCVYLIMRGIALLGPDTLAPARTADQFVSALIDADLGTGDWDISASWPFNRDSRRVQRRGGRVHKVIRWAFEQQGLYATPDPRTTAEGPGLPPQVDVYIADRRGDNGSAGDGGYKPVPLRHAEADQPWHAHGDWVRRTKGRLCVRVANRGAKLAVRARVQAWWAQAGVGGETVDWIRLASGAARQDIPAGGNVEFSFPFRVEAGARPWVLVSAHAPADGANLTGDAPPSSWAEVLELVAHDNNLALARL